MRDLEDFKRFFYEAARDFFDEEFKKVFPDLLLKVIVSQFEKNQVCIFIFDEDKNQKRKCGGHYWLCDIENPDSSMSICELFKIIKFLKDEHDIDSEINLDWFTKWTNGNY